jgi:hypothetical protein
MLELGLLEESQSSSTCRSRSPGKPTMKVERIAMPGHRLADPAQQLPDGGAAALASHGQQHVVGDVLQRHVEVATDRRLVRHHFQQIVANGRG